MLPSPSFGHVLFSSFSPILLYQIGTQETRALINIPKGLKGTKSANGRVQNYIKHRVLPNLPVSIQPTFAINLKKGRLHCIPNSFLPAAPNRTPGVIIKVSTYASTITNKQANTSSGLTQSGKRE